MSRFEKQQATAGIGLYVHVPFCRRKCAYCAFYSIASPPRELEELYLRALKRELNDAAEYSVATVYLGGGTPTSLEPAILSALLGMIADRCGSTVREWTCEANPETLDEARMDLLRSSGVNRISVGVQTFDPARLAFLGRVHTPQQSIEALERLRRAGFSNINVDLIYGLPGSSAKALERDLAILLGLRPEHISVYLLSVEEGTRFHQLEREGKLPLPAEEEQAEQYELIRQALVTAGYEHYEISNFALPGYRCRHNWLYWSAGEYLGCGPAAHSFIRGVRWANVADTVSWAKGLLAGRPARVPDEELCPERRARELLVLALRRVEGVQRGWFKAVTGVDLDQLCGAEIEELTDQGLLLYEQGRLRLSPRAYFVSDAVFRELI